MKLCLTLWDPWTAAHQDSLSFTISWSLLKLMSIGFVMPSNHLILCHPLLLLPSVFPSIRLFSKEMALCIRCPKDQSLSFSISLSNEYSELISFGTDGCDLLAVQGTLESFLQHHNSKASYICYLSLSLVNQSMLVLLRICLEPTPNINFEQNFLSFIQPRDNWEKKTANMCEKKKPNARYTF